jgi:hypothetical protein
MPALSFLGISRQIEYFASCPSLKALLLKMFT